MSTNLYWKPLDTEHYNLSDKLKFAIRKKYDGFVKTKLNISDIDYLQGLSDAGISDAESVIKAIQKHGEILLFEEWRQLRGDDMNMTVVTCFLFLSFAACMGIIGYLAMKNVSGWGWLLFVCILFFWVS